VFPVQDLSDRLKGWALWAKHATCTGNRAHTQESDELR